MSVLAVVGLLMVVMLGAFLFAGYSARPSNDRCEEAVRTIKIGQSRGEAEQTLTRTFELLRRSETESIFVCRIERNGVSALFPEYTLKVSLTIVDGRVKAIKMWD